MFKLSVVLLVGAVVALGKTVPKADNIFRKSFTNLHKDPAPPAQTRGHVQVLSIKQRLDHFDENETRTWNMRYMANGEFFEEGGPMFVYVGGEWSISPGYISGGHVYDMAKEHHGYLFYTEHRYYGASHPLPDLSTENLKYLNVKQALADLAHFIRTMRQEIPGMENSKAILTGGSYSATMVTWFKKLYPDLVAGSWASSAPLYAKVDFWEYKEVMRDSIRLAYGEECNTRIRNGIETLETMFEEKRAAEVKAMLHLCDNFDETNDLDVWSLFGEISDTFAGVVQTHDGDDIQQACKTIMDGADDVTGLITYVLKKWGDPGTCNDLTYNAFLTSLKETAYNGAMRQWMYQTCNEFGWYQTSSSKEQPFGSKFPLPFYTTLCADAYSSNFTEKFIKQQVDKTNDFFEGLELKVDNVYMTHGELDPWRAMGLQEGEQTTIIPMHAHCKDLNSIQDSDTPEMRASKEKISQLVRKWLAE
uniref:Prolylcarboxypeptidase n=1 Tax=Glossina morsitans morsitans TaxID=37546 RepID=A0A1B0GB71_GLOMM